MNNHRLLIDDITNIRRKDYICSLPRSAKANIMKQLFLISFIILSISSISKAQSIKAIPNGDFESWDSASYTYLDSPWISSNYGYLTPDSFINVTKVKGKTGFAVHIGSVINIMYQHGGHVAMMLLDSQTPAGISGYYRSHLINNDTAWVVVEFIKGGVFKLLKFPIFASKDTFTEFNFSIPMLPGRSDTVTIGAILDLPPSIADTGSWFELDQLAFTGSGITQQIPDGDFDSWTTIYSHLPTGWATPSSPANSGISKSTDHYSGKYSVKLSSQPSLGYFGELWSGKYGTGGPFNLTMDTLTGYYKYNSLMTDSGGISVNLMQGGSYVGFSKYYFHPSASWQYFELPINSFNNVPDTMQITINSTTDYNDTLGCSLYLDDLQLKSQPVTSGLHGLSKTASAISAFPDPTQNQLNIRFGSNPPSELGIKIYNPEGKLVLDNGFRSGSTTVTVPIDQLSAGLYFYEITANGSTVRNRFVKAN